MSGKVAMAVTNWGKGVGQERSTLALVFRGELAKFTALLVAESNGRGVGPDCYT